MNIYVGIGIPWLIDTAYNFVVYREPLRIQNAEGLSFSLLVFFATSVGCIAVLVYRRVTLGAELGGPRLWAWVTCVYFMLLWIIFVVLSSLKVSGIIWKVIINVFYLNFTAYYYYYFFSPLSQYCMLYVSNAFPSFCLVPSFGTKLYFPSSEGFWNSSYYVLISQIKAFSAAFIRSLHEVLPHDQNTVSRWWPFIILINHNNRSPRLLLSSEDNHLTS